MATIHEASVPAKMLSGILINRLARTNENDWASGVITQPSTHGFSTLFKIMRFDDDSDQTAWEDDDFFNTCI